VRTYHIADPSCLLSPRELKYRPVGGPSTNASHEAIAYDWLPAGPVVIGLTAGASTPNNIVGEVIERLEQFAAAP
jgi:4-hydroxy-3-methylbut-2-enyl diphosphate reductase